MSGDPDRLLGRRARARAGSVEVAGRIVVVEPARAGEGDADRVVEIQMPAQEGVRLAVRRRIKDIEMLD